MAWKIFKRWWGKKDNKPRGKAPNGIASRSARQQSTRPATVSSPLTKKPNVRASPSSPDRDVVNQLSKKSEFGIVERPALSEANPKQIHWANLSEFMSHNSMKRLRKALLVTDCASWSRFSRILDSSVKGAFTKENISDPTGARAEAVKRTLIFGVPKQGERKPIRGLIFENERLQKFFEKAPGEIKTQFDRLSDKESKLDSFVKELELLGYRTDDAEHFLNTGELREKIYRKRKN